MAANRPGTLVALATGSDKAADDATSWRPLVELLSLLRPWPLVADTVDIFLLSERPTPRECRSGYTLAVLSAGDRHSSGGWKSRREANLPRVGALIAALASPGGLILAILPLQVPLAALRNGNSSLGIKMS